MRAAHGVRVGATVVDGDLKGMLSREPFGFDDASLLGAVNAARQGQYARASTLVGTLVPTRAANAWHFDAFSRVCTLALCTVTSGTLSHFNVARHRSTQHHLDMGADAFKLSRLRANRGKVFCL